MSGSSAISLVSSATATKNSDWGTFRAATEQSSASVVAAVQAVFSDGEMSVIKARILLIEQRRQALGPPVPTPGYPLPKEGLVCRRCRREYRKTRGSMSGVAAKAAKSPSPFLEPARPGATECKPCRNVKRWAFPTWEVKDLLESLDSDEVFFVKYVCVVFLYEDVSTDKIGAVISCADQLPGPLQLMVYSESTVAIEGATALGVLWPIDIYRAHNGGKYPPKHLLKNYVHNKMKIRGIIRETVHGNPIGTTQLTEKVSEGIRKSSKLGDSTMAARGQEQIQELYEALRSNSAVSVTAVAKKDDDHEDVLGVSFKFGDKSFADDAGDFLNSLWQQDSLAGLAVAPTPKKARTGTTATGGSPASVTSSTGGASAQRGTSGTDSAAGAAVHSSALGASETVVFKCRLLMQDLYNNATVMYQTPKKLEAQLKLIKGRMSDRVMEYYAADYGKAAKHTENHSTPDQVYGPPCVSD